MLDFRRPRGTLWVVLVLAVIVALALLAIAVCWGHSPPAAARAPVTARPPVAADEPELPGRRAA